jgi:hypothetical protein
MRHEATEGRSAAAPVQGGAGQQARRGAARLRPYRGGRAAGTEGRSTAAPVQGAARGKRREGRGVVYERRR